MYKINHRVKLTSSDLSDLIKWVERDDREVVCPWYRTWDKNIIRFPCDEICMEVFPMFIEMINYRSKCPCRRYPDVDVITRVAKRVIKYNKGPILRRIQNWIMRLYKEI